MNIPPSVHARGRRPGSRTGCPARSGVEFSLPPDVRDWLAQVPNRSALVEWLLRNVMAAYPDGLPELQPPPERP